MEKLTTKQFKNDFDTIFSRVENGETFIIQNANKKFLLSPYNNLVNDDIELFDDFIINHKHHNDAS